jgi:hypothetical protein
MKTILLLLTSIVCSYTYCQDSANAKLPVQVQALLQYDFPESYGLSAGIVVQLTTNEHKRNYRNSSDYHLWISSLEVAWLHYPSNSSAINANAGIGVRISKYPGHYHEWLIEEGFLRTFYMGTVYTMSSDGNIKELSGFGRTYATTGISYLQNWDINPVSFIIKPSLWIQYPFNGFIKPHTSLKIGARFFFNHKKSSRYAS